MDIYSIEDPKDMETMCFFKALTPTYQTAIL